MQTDPPVTCWLNQLKLGDRAALDDLWKEYYPKLVGLAAKKLRGVPDRLVMPEDLADSAFESFWLAAEKGRFPRLADRDDLWQVLLHIVRYKAADAWEHVTRGKRDFRRENAFLQPDPDDSADVSFVKEMLSREPDPAFAAEVADECEFLLAVLPDRQLRLIAQAKMEGHTNAEIAELLGCALATVERRLNLIRRKWLAQVPTLPPKKRSSEA